MKHLEAPEHIDTNVRVVVRCKRASDLQTRAQNTTLASELALKILCIEESRGFCIVQCTITGEQLRERVLFAHVST